MELFIDDWAEQITAAWNSSVEGILECGRLLIRAKSKLAHGQFLAMVETLPFGENTAQRLMQIAEHPVLSNPAHGPLLPPYWRTLYELTKLSVETVSTLIDQGKIRPEMERRDVAQWVKKRRRETRERELGEEMMREGHYGVIYADPPWRFEPYSRLSGMDRAADNHYPTMDLDSIMAMDIPAAEDCVLFLWATVPMLPQALLVVESWGFTYKSHFVWSKDRSGTGYWNRNRHELLIVATKGDIPAPAPGDQYESVIEARVFEHSAKPIAFSEMIEELFPTLPRIELFAREPRTGWDTWGNEVDDAA